MNVLIITVEDVFYVYEFFKEFYPLTQGAPYKLLGITVLKPFNKKSTIDLAKQMYGFYGSFYFVKMGFLYVVRKLLKRSVIGIAQQIGIPSFPTASVNSPEYISLIMDLNIDVIISIASPQVFKKDLLASVSKGCINSHSALLPENKGMMPVFWGLFKNAKEIGVTIHFMDDDLDSGDIIRQERVPVGDESLEEMISRTKKISAHMMHEVLCDFAKGDVTRTPMPSGGSYQTFPTPAEVKEFKRRGKRLF